MTTTLHTPYRNGSIIHRPWTQTQIAVAVLAAAMLCRTAQVQAQCADSHESMFSHDEDHAEPCDDRDRLVQPETDPTDSLAVLAADALGEWVPGSPPPVGGGPNVITINTHSMVGSPTTGLVSAADAFALANTDGVATRIEFDPTVFHASAGPLHIDGPLQLLSDFDEVDGAGAFVVLQPSGTSTDDAVGIGLVARDTAVRNLTLDGFSVTGVVAAGLLASPTIENVTVLNSGLHGVLVLDNADVTLDGCTLMGTGDDAVRVDNASATMKNCHIDGSGEHGVAAINSNLRFEGNDLTGYTGWGLLFAGASPGLLSLPSAHVSSDCIDDIFGGNIFEPGPNNWFVAPQAQTSFDDLLAPDLDFPDYVNMEQPVDFYLPFTKNAEVTIGQGYNNPNTHACSLGLDFNLWAGVDNTYIRAAARGRVIRTLNWLAGPAASKSGNTVVIDHGYGLISSYTHLKHNSITVQPGQMVERYQILGLGSSTGNSAGPHLHVSFSKYRSRRVWPEQFPNPADHDCGDGDPFWQVTFADIPGGIPHEKQRDNFDNCVMGVHPEDPDKCAPFISGNDEDLNPPPFEDSYMARDLFIDRNNNAIEADYDNGDGVIELTSKVPMAYYQAEQEYVFRGNAPVGAKVISLAIQDYVTREIIETVEGLVDSEGRFSIAKTFCDPGAYRITLDAAHYMVDSEWSFYYRSSDFYSIIVVGQSGVTQTPPYYHSRVLCSPQLDFDNDGIPNIDDPDDDGDGVLDANDGWRDIVVNTTGDSNTSIGKWSVSTALKAANTDCMKTRISFHPAVFPPNNPATIMFDRDIRTGNHGDLLTGAGAGVIFAATDADTRRALTMIGATGMSVRDIEFQDFSGGIISVSYGTKAWFDGCVLSQGVGADGTPFRCREKSTVNFKNGLIYGNLAEWSNVVSVIKDATLTMSNTELNTGYNGIRTYDNAHIKLCNVDFEGFLDNGLRMNGTSTGEVTDMHVIFSHDGVDLQDNAQLQLRDSLMSNVDRGIVLRDNSELHVCNTISSINSEEYTLDDNVVTDWFDMPIGLFGGSIVGGACEAITCEPQTKFGVINDLEIAQPKNPGWTIGQ